MAACIECVCITRITSYDRRWTPSTHAYQALMSGERHKLVDMRLIADGRDAHIQKVVLMVCMKYFSTRQDLIVTGTFVGAAISDARLQTNLCCRLGYIA